MDNSFRTRDIGLASYLSLGGHAYTVEQDEGSSVWFLFPTVTRKNKNAYFNGHMVAARAYYRVLVRLKAVVFWLTHEEEE